MRKRTEPQTVSILNHLMSGGKLTALDALKYFKVLRLSARVKEIRDMGFNVGREMIQVDSGKRIANYFIKQ